MMTHEAYTHLDADEFQGVRDVVGLKLVDRAAIDHKRLPHRSQNKRVDKTF